MSYLRQVWTLTFKNLTILYRHPITIVYFPFLLPIALSIFFSVAQDLFQPPLTNGEGDLHAIRSLAQALDGSTHRHRIVFVNNGFADGPIDEVIDALVSDAESVSGIEALRRGDELALNVDCEPGQRGVTDCFGAVSFHSSPTEGDGRLWNYTIFHDGAANGFRFQVDRNTNDQDLYLLPFQKAVDDAIANIASANSSGSGSGSGSGDEGQEPSQLPDTIDRWPFTSDTQEELRENTRQQYQQSLINFLGVVYIAMVGFVTYHLTGFIASERETGMTQLLDAMMPVKRRWLAQLARILSYHLAFDLLYIPGWVVTAIVVRANVFSSTSLAIVLIYNILAGFAMASFAIMISSLFQKAQLSGITSLLSTVLLAILAQAITGPDTVTVIVLSVLFAPCGYVYFIINMARFERRSWPTDLLTVAPNSDFDVVGLVFFVLIALQIFIYPLIGALIESFLWGTTTKGRAIRYNGPAQGSEEAAVRLENFSKHYPPSLWGRLFSFVSKPRDTVRAVDNLTLGARRGQILALLGANGSGKSTTLDAIAGTNRLTSGSINIDGRGGLGIAPQKNVLWDDLTVEEHLEIFNRLKSPGQTASKEELRDLVRSIDLDIKRRSKSKTLSGGQKRKLQLGMMLTGGSQVCCVDEVSSGVDPLSRRKIWDILLAERGRRTILLTTHFLDEADILADHIAILSKGTLRASGSSAELKDNLGAGYRVHVRKDGELKTVPQIEGVQQKTSFDMVTYLASSSALAAKVIRSLETEGIRDYNFSGPTIEDVFLQLAEEIKGESETNLKNTIDEKHPGASPSSDGDAPQPGLKLMDGKPIGYFRQGLCLYRKRWTIFKVNFLPLVAAFIIPIVAAGLTTFFIKDAETPRCGPPETSFAANSEGLNFSGDQSFGFVIGPEDKFDLLSAASVLGPIFSGIVGGGEGDSASASDGDNGTGQNFLSEVWNENTTLVNTFSEFQDAVVRHRKEVRPAGLWLGTDDAPATLAYLGEGGMTNALFGQNMLDMLLSNVSIAARYAPMRLEWPDQNTDSLQLLVYFALALCIYPGFFALYPALERRGQVRALQYSNGVRPVPLWLAYITFDYAGVLVSSAIVIIMWAALSDIWYHLPYMFIILILYGLSSILLAYNVSLFAATQLAAYANVAMYQVLFFLVYIIAYFYTSTLAPVETLDSSLLLVHFVISIFAPIGSVTRSLFLTLNLFSTACDKDEYAPTPGGLLQYGGPILYLAVQSLVLFSILLWADSASPGSSIRKLFRRKRGEKAEAAAEDAEVANELVRVTGPEGSKDGLRIQHVTKSFGKNIAVDNVTFGIKRGEVFATLGPNGAGKSTLISLIRGDLKPSRNGGDIFVEDKSVISDLAMARSNLGVCPQHDALDLMTVRDHLEFYARVRGIPDIDVNVESVLAAVGLQAFSNRMAHALSGGNKRKLSLGIALMGNPTVILLDEPSSGLDAAAKRIMWKTLAAVVPGRSILLTTHSMEEASALATRAGILAKRMLALGTVEGLQQRFGDVLHVHLVSKSAPYTTPEETESVRAWVTSTFPQAEFDKTYHGQMRFAVPAHDVVGSFGGGRREDITQSDEEGTPANSAVGKLVVLLEEKKEALGVLHYSVSPTTLDQVFLAIVGRHNVQEEGYRLPEKKGWNYWVRKSFCLPPPS